MPPVKSRSGVQTPTGGSRAWPPAGLAAAAAASDVPMGRTTNGSRRPYLGCPCGGGAGLPGEGIEKWPNEDEREEEKGRPWPVRRRLLRGTAC